MTEITIRTSSRRELVDVTGRVAAAVAGEAEPDGAWVLSVPHTTAGILVNEGADPSVARDVLMALERLAPEDLPYEHAEGNSPAHVLSSLVGSSVIVIVEGGELELGTWQAVFFCEFDGPRTRRLRLYRA